LDVGYDGFEDIAVRLRGEEVVQLLHGHTEVTLGRAAKRPSAGGARPAG
jgi:hypothetical protein